MKRTISFIFVSLFVLSFSFKSYSQAPFSEESPAKTDLREAVFRYMFEHYRYGPDVKVFCIQPERPLPESFLLRFSGNKPRVVWVWDCELTAAAMNGVKEKKTGERGLRMTVMSIEWIGAQEAEAKVSAFSDGIAANWNILRVVLKEGHWIVKSDKPNGVS
jgi:hypothetical protein